MHELKQVYQKQLKIAVGLAFVIHLLFVGIAVDKLLFGPEERYVSIRLLPYTEMISIKAPEVNEPESAPLLPPPPVEQPPEEAPPPEVMSEIIPVPDWMDVDSLMADVELAEEHEIQEITQEVANAGGGETGTGNGNITSQDGMGEASEAAIPVDEMPRLLKKVEPEYPRIAKITGVEGVVVLSILVDESGHVTDTKVLKSLGNTGCDEAAITAAMQWRFIPAKHDGKSVAMWVRVPVLFQLKAGG